MNLVNEERFAQVDPAERILECAQDCSEPCVVRTFREEAARQGYGGVCVAAGGKMAVRFVRENGARGILAVACDEELKMGVKAVQEMQDSPDDSPAIVVPLLKDGCVDTEVDAELVLRAINLHR
jgi:hypothetical protein